MNRFKVNDMLSWFNKKRALSIDSSNQNEEVHAAPGFSIPKKADELLNTPRRQKLLAHIWQRTSISRKQFLLLYLQPIQKYAELVQEFPASESHHHAYPGGMLDHGLEIVAYALKLRQSYLLPIGSTPEEQTAQAETWTAGIAYAALLHDIGKIAVDLHVEYESNQVWHPWHGPIKHPYRFRYLKGREYRLHNASAGLVYHQILNPAILDWLSQTPDLWAALLYLLAGQNEHAGVLGEIVTKADQASVAQELGGDPAKAMQAPKHALQRKLLDGLRYLIKEELKLNNPGPSDGWLTDDALWLVSKTVSDKLRAHLLSSGVSGIPEKNSAVFDVLQEHAIIQATPDDKAIWTATVKSESGWSTQFTFLKVAPALIWSSGEKPESFSGSVLVKENAEAVAVVSPQSDINPVAQNQNIPPSEINTNSVQQADSLGSVLDILGFEDAAGNGNIDTEPVQTVADDDKPVEPALPKKTVRHIKGTEENQSEAQTDLKDVTTIPYAEKPMTELVPVSENELSGEHFLAWLKEGILNRKLIINEPRALIHTVENTLYLVTPGIFKRYVLEYPVIQKLADQDNVMDWRWVQKRFEKVKAHKKQANGLNIWKCIVQGPRKTREVSGYLLTDPTYIMPDVPFNNPYLAIKKSD